MIPIFYLVLDGILNNDYQKVFPIQLTYGEDIKKSEYSSKNKKINTLTNEVVIIYNVKIAFFKCH